MADRIVLLRGPDGEPALHVENVLVEGRWLDVVTMVDPVGVQHRMPLSVAMKFSVAVLAYCEAKAKAMDSGIVKPGAN